MPRSTSTSTKDRPYHHGDLRGALILQAICEVEAVGMEHLSLRSVAHEVGVSPSAAYHHFVDKDALIAAVALEGVAQLNFSLATAMTRYPRGEAASAQKRASAAGLAYITFAVEHPNLFRIAFSGHCPRPPEREKNPLIVELFDDLVATGALPADLREGSEEVMWAAVHGMATLVLEGKFAVEEVPHCLAALERMMRLRP